MEYEELIYTVHKARAGNMDAHGKLFEAFHNMVYGIALRETKSKSFAEDIVQETFLEVIRTIDTLQEPAAFSSWLKTLTYHQCTRYYKRKETRHELPLDETEGETLLNSLTEERTEFIPDAVVDQQDFRETLLAMLDELPDAQSAALRMFYYDELPLKTIAQVQGVSVNTANTRLHRGRAAVKKSVEDYERKHGVRLHVFAFLPLFKWLLAGAEAPMSEKAAAAVGKTIACAREATPKAPAGKNVPGKVGKGLGVKGAAKAAGISLSTKIAAGVAAAAMTVSIPVAVVRMNHREASPNTDQPVVQEIQEIRTDAAGATAAATDREETQIVTQNLRDAYESLLRAGVTQDGLPIEYYAILDLEGDGVEELIVADQNGTPETMTSCEAYTYRDGDVRYLGCSGSHWDYLYHANSRYLCGSTRLGCQYLSSDESFSFTIYHWNETMTRNDPAISRNGGPWEYITQEKFDYYNPYPLPGGDSDFVETAEIISLSENPYREKNILEKTLDFSKAWVVCQEYDGVSFGTCYAFEKDGSVYCVFGQMYSEWSGKYTGTYSVDGDILSISLNYHSGSVSFSYRFDPEGRTLTQISKRALISRDTAGTVVTLEEYPWGDAQQIKEMVRSGLSAEEWE